MHEYRRYKHFIVGVAALILSLGLSSCSKDKHVASDADRAANKKSTDRLIQHMAKPNQERVGLLAIKYDVPAEVVEKLIDAYLSVTDDGYKSFKKIAQGVKEPTNSGADPLLSLTRDKSSYDEILKALSTQFSVAPETTASLIMDYQILNAVSPK